MYMSVCPPVCVCACVVSVNVKHVVCLIYVCKSPTSSSIYVSVFHMHIRLAWATLWAIIKQDCGRVTENNIILTH